MSTKIRRNMSEKNRKLKYLTYAQRKEIIEKLDQNVSQRRLAIEYGVSASTVNAINKPESRNEILKSIEKSSEASSQRKRAPVKYAELNKLVFSYVEDCRTKNERISGPGLKETAKKIARQLKIEGFSASNGWLSVFCTKYKISFRNQDVSKKEKEETEELMDSTAEDTNLLDNNNESALEDHFHIEDDVEFILDDREHSPPPVESPLPEVPPKRQRLDFSSEVGKRTPIVIPPRALHGPPSNAPTVLHSNGMVFVTLANGITVEIDNESINIRTTSNDLVSVNEKTTSIQSGTSQVTVKEGVIQIKPVETEIL